MEPRSEVIGLFSSIAVKRIYDPVEPSDGTRLLIDGIWPRGVPRSEFPDDSWRPDLAPSTELRGWYRHDPGRFAGFSARYRAELEGNAVVPEVLVGSGPLTLLTATRQVDISHAVVLRDYLDELLAM